MVAQTKQQAAYIEKYLHDPIRFQCEVLDTQPEHVWSKMRELADSVDKHQRTAAHSGHGVSKTYEAARLALWWLFTHIPSTVITTAPVYDQVEKLLWKEIHRAHSHARLPLGGNLTKVQLDVDPDAKWFAYGFSTKPDTVTGEATRIQGYHNKYVLVIFDEAAGIMPQIWKAVESLLTNENCHILAIGNPTSAHGTFADCEEDPSWHFIRISVHDTPNFIEGKEIIPEISGRSYEESMRRKYGADSQEYGIRVLGRKPAFTLGTYLGKWLADAELEGRIDTTEADYMNTLPVYSAWDTGDMYTAIWFFQLVHNHIHFIDFEYDYQGKGLPYFAVLLQNKGYRYLQHWAPPDIIGSNGKSFQSGRYTVDVAEDLGISFDILRSMGNKEDRIEAAKSIMPVSLFSPKCAEGIQGLKDWRKRKNEALSTPEKPVYHEEAMKTWGRHVGDGYSHVAMAYRYHIVVDDRIIGYPHVEPVYGNKTDKYSYDPLKASSL
uniref:Putative terminase n=1 Tax=viral metagenome TaxID=1070528 RepID=A0A6H1ZPW5_9ZZZZ